MLKHYRRHIPHENKPIKVPIRWFLSFVSGNEVQNCHGVVPYNSDLPWLISEKEGAKGLEPSPTK